MPLRYVILHHVQSGGEHWDLMIEQPADLLTWQLECEPRTPADLPLAARRIGRHRKAYLACEGSVSRGRGEVRRIDRGTCRLERVNADRYRLTLSKGRLEGCFELVRIQGDRWSLREATTHDDS